ncbi:hypothetical protein [Prochlorococcus sp. MIT 1300]|uniref:hypothetical protein n=1 Tax=Prochlorococcus sp. MIT 1300 TaxID=3096218 RepID=UPI002A74ACB1|nr:hypothetical protein [Prochlorococcus sp. MIT 1300]
MKRLGLDFDNTLVSYDQVFYDLALSKKLITEEVAPTKVDIRSHLIQKGLEDDFTSLQGEVYGSQLANMVCSNTVKCALKYAKSQGFQLFIISHKTKFPYKGPKYDLHKAATRWLEGNDFFDEADGLITRSDVYFEPTMEKKVKRIVGVKCTHFIDDLSQVLESIPAYIKRIHFNPLQKKSSDRYCQMTDWKELKDWI